MCHAEEDEVADEVSRLKRPNAEREKKPKGGEAFATSCVGVGSREKTEDSIEMLGQRYMESWYQTTLLILSIPEESRLFSSPPNPCSSQPVLHPCNWLKSLNMIS
jgi:hypothetical protein